MDNKFEFYTAKLFTISMINEHLSCFLCKGYLIEATTIIECLHSFCKSCIINYVTKEKHCPICGCLIHKTRPTLNIRSDMSLQSLVYKLIPGLYEDEIQRRRAFFAQNSKKIKDKQGFYSKMLLEESEIETYNVDMYSPTDEINILLKYHLTSEKENFSSLIEKSLANFKRYLQCEISLSVELLKKFLQKKFSIPYLEQIELYRLNHELNDELTLMDIVCSLPPKKNEPLELTFYICELNNTETESFGDNSAKQPNTPKSDKKNNSNNPNCIAKIRPTFSPISLSPLSESTGDVENENIISTNKTAPDIVDQNEMVNNINDVKTLINDSKSQNQTESWRHNLMAKVDKACQQLENADIINKSPPIEKCSIMSPPVP